MKTLVKMNNGRNQFVFDDFFMRDFFGAPVKQRPALNTMPSVNIKETDTAYELELAAPGMDKKEFKIELENDTLVISAQREVKAEEKNEDGKYSRREFSYQSFKRSFNLPENGVDGEQISASYRDGILYVLVPKKEPVKAKAVKEIQVA